MTQWKKTVQEHIPLAFVLLCILLAFIRWPVTGESLYGSDFVLYFNPLKEFIRNHFLSHGTMPLWNPYQFSGTPLIGNIQVSLFYPLGFLFYLMPSDHAYGYTVVMHCMLGSIFMYLFMRGISISPRASCFSAIVFAFNGYFMAHVYAGHLSFVQNYVWIPLIFFFLHRFVEKRDIVHALAAGLILGIQILGGFPQIAFYTILGSVAFFVPFFVMEARKRSYRGVFKLGVGLSATILIGFALAAVQVLPTLAFTRLSTRATGVSYFFATLDSLHPKEVLAFLIPDIFGNPTDKTYWSSTGSWHFWETCGYIGILPLFLIFVKEERKELTLHRGFFIVLIIVSLLLALGKHNPLYPLIYMLPGFGSFRIPAQIIFLYVFSVAILSGVGLDRILLGEWKFAKGFWIFVLITGALTFLPLVSLWFSRYHTFFYLFKNFAEGPVSHIDMAKLYHNTLLSLNKASLLLLCCTLLMLLHKWRRIGKGIFILLAFGILAADLYPFCKMFLKPYDYSFSQEKQQIIQQFYKDPTQGRIVTIGDVFRANDGLTGRFPSILGYDPLILRRYAHYMQASQGIELSDHLVNLEDIDLSQTKLLKSLNLRQIFVNGYVTRFDNDIPYANVVYDVAIKAQEEVLPFMKSSQFDPRKTVVLEPDKGKLLLNQRVDKNLSSACTVLHYENERITIRASTDQAGYLVISEMYYPGWQATVDGKRTPILRGNFLFRVIPLEAGEHEVELRFVSWPFRIGAVISLLALAIVCSLVVTRWRKSGLIEGTCDMEGKDFR